MAGHIDHGKTTLTKALTGVETDRLKEEQERKISIEPGFAPLVQTEDVQISIIDVPGHERFIRQMIAGVAGIDFVVLVIAGDEGVMPQTQEHIAILSLLGVKDGMIAITKIDESTAELIDLVQEDITQLVAGTFLEKAPRFLVDSVTNRGVKDFKDVLIETVKKIDKRTTTQPFRLPIDDVFTITGQGVVVRGTVFAGAASIGDELTLLPGNVKVRVRKMESHHEEREIVFTGQRVAMNLGGISHRDVKRGCVLVKGNYYISSKRIDIAFKPLGKINHVLKQRHPIKFYVGTSEVKGKIIFFDRNELTKENHEEVLCQIQLEEPVVVTRGDRFILRRATPIETIGGGWIIEPQADKHRFGATTIQLLKQKKEGTPKERIERLLQQQFALVRNELLQLTGVTASEFSDLEKELVSLDKQTYTVSSVISRVSEEIKSKLMLYHQTYPLRKGMNRAELVSELTSIYPERLVEFVLLNEEENKFRIQDLSVSLTSFTPHVPENWRKKSENAFKEWEEQGAEIDKMTDIFTRHSLPESLHTDLYYYLLHMDLAYEYDEGRLISRKAAEKIRTKLFEKTMGASFTLQTARDITALSRKNLVPLLELFDRLGYTERVGNERTWQ